uniref:NADH dehydrogenase subunit 1 n=1 Tax=Gormaniella terricola TaxID=2904618 RepID=UPI0021CCB08C|nr:NADH dehydrogenase subunit 1 [Gormaniella terricola]UWV18310.1 NADH dehydrogenase subunit 1 [Gormaniella terricola]
MLFFSLHIVLILLPLLLSVALLTLAERKLMASMQRRVGPSVWGFYGFLQPFLDGLKLILKEPMRPSNADTPLFIAAPALTFVVSLIAWAVFPDEDGVVFANIYLAALYLLMVSSLGVYGLMLAGWSSNSVYAFLGCCRAVAQMISYELSLGVITITVCLVVGSVNLSNMVSWQQDVWLVLILFPQLIMWFICCLAETNRAPFDLTEAEAELVAGYHVEYSAMSFALFFISEYANMFMMSLFCSMLFFGGGSNSSILWALEMTLIVSVFVWVRATLPRYRYDQLMRLGWKTLLPLSLALFLLNGAILLCFETWPIAV